VNFQKALRCGSIPAVGDGGNVDAFKFQASMPTGDSGKMMNFKKAALVGAVP
jgi:hypothetical protein